MKVSFKISKDESGRTVRTHVASGLKVVTTKTTSGTEFVFYGPGRDGDDYWGEAHTMAEMKWMAEERVAQIETDREIAYEDALLIWGEIIANGLDAVANVAEHHALKPVRTLWAAAAHSLESGFHDAASNRLRRLMEILGDPSLVDSDPQADANRAAAEEAFGIGQVCERDIDGETWEVTIDGAPRVEAETNRVFISYTVCRNGRKRYGSCYVTDLRLPETGRPIEPAAVLALTDEEYLSQARAIVEGIDQYARRNFPSVRKMIEAVDKAETAYGAFKAAGAAKDVADATAKLSGTDRNRSFPTR